MRDWRLVLGACVCALAMLGCGGDDGDDSMDDAGTGGSDSGMQAMTDSGTDEDSGTPPVDAGRADSGGGGGTDAGVDGGGGDDEPTFAELRASLMPTCGGGGCHGAAAMGGFSLVGTDAAVYAELTEEARASANCSANTRRVVPGNTSMSVLYLKTHGTTCGNMMPANAAQRQLIEDWINAGAPGPT
ncbi:hypothetical protein [Sandaracinus amylolyticus]|uniref:hypothetical protein n=1 Tax=Sandaracinus amylolyticus TaxID=927083 RepID=UPI001F4113D2|nr:hypothetical protein [Sandaracinus amylolyticus]UJR79426.1 Hypothetical protein I5071_14620 [Sandaracinus amylolyticus]